MLVTEEEAAGAAAVPAAPPPVEIGGSYRFSLTGEANWASLADLAEAPLQPDSHSATVDLGAAVFLDARPADDFRVFGKVDLSYPFTTDPDAQPAREFDDIVRVKELFSDFTIGDALFLRGGKHTIAWGVGYFFSPGRRAQPDRDRSGGSGCRTRGTGVAARQPADRLPQPLPVRDRRPDRRRRAACGRAQGGGGAGRRRGGHRRLLSPRPGAARHGDTEQQPAGVRSVSWSWRPAWARTGASWSVPLAVPAIASGCAPCATATICSQRPPPGCATPTHRSSRTGRPPSRASTCGTAKATRTPGCCATTAPGSLRCWQRGDLSRGDLVFQGRHYAAASLNVALGRGADWSAGVFWLSNLSDGSGQVSPSLTFRPADRFSLRAGRHADLRPGRRRDDPVRQPHRRHLHRHPRLRPLLSAGVARPRRVRARVPAPSGA